MSQMHVSSNDTPINADKKKSYNSTNISKTRDDLAQVYWPELSWIHTSSIVIVNRKKILMNYLEQIKFLSSSSFSKEMIYAKSGEYKTYMYMRIKLLLKWIA